MKRIIGLFLVASLVLVACAKKVDKQEGQIFSNTVSSNLFNYSDWWQQTQGSNANNNDAWVATHLSPTQPGTLYFGDDLLWNWLTVPSGTFPNAHWPINVAGATRGINRGIRGVRFKDVPDYLDSLQKYRTVVASLDVTIGTHDVWYYKNYGGNLWNTCPQFTSELKNAVYLLKNRFPTQGITLTGIPISNVLIATPEFVVQDLIALNISIKAWCDSSLTDNLVFRDPNGTPGLAITDFGGNYDAKFPSVQGYYNMAQLYTNVKWGTAYVGQNPIALMNGTVTGVGIYVCAYPGNFPQFNVNANTSYDPDGTIVKYQWRSLSSNLVIASGANSVLCTVTRQTPWPVFPPMAVTPNFELTIWDNHYNKTIRQVALRGTTCP